MAESSPTIDQLYEVIASRRGVDPRESYTAKLYADGRAKIVRKFGEEAIEVCVAALSEGRDEVVASLRKWCGDPSDSDGDPPY